jgi:SAM-dependent methyltransferase
MTEKLLVPIYLPNWLRKSMIRAKRVVIPPKPININIHGERSVEWTFLSKEMGNGPGQALEFGCENGYLSLLAAQKGFHVSAVDLEPQSFTWVHPLVKFRQGDFLTMDLPSNHYDLVINCSSVEHVGVAGRYGITVEQEGGDIEVMERFAKILKHGGIVLMTAPCGQDAVLAPWCRVYGRQRLPKLFSFFSLVKETFWVKNAENQWTICGRDAALDFEPHHDPSDPYACSYALGCFVLRSSGYPGRTAQRER